ncbi:hypothetical protein GBAR_LOCUS13212, partial [Geodia barretti]
SSVGVEVTPGIKYKFELLSTVSQKWIIGFPLTKDIKIETTKNHFSSRHGGGVTLSENATVVTATRVDDAMAYTAL